MDGPFRTFFLKPDFSNSLDVVLTVVISSNVRSALWSTSDMSIRSSSDLMAALTFFSLEQLLVRPLQSIFYTLQARLPPSILNNFGAEPSFGAIHKVCTHLGGGGVCPKST